MYRGKNLIEITLELGVGLIITWWSIFHHYIADKENLVS